MNFKLEQQCPQCGAPLSLQETERLLECSYCRVRHILTWAEHPDYYLPPLRNMPGRLLYFPYWRMRGLALAVSGMEVKSRIVDTSQLASPNLPAPASLGIHAQAVTLHTVQADTAGTFLASDFEVKKFIKTISAKALGIGPKAGAGSLQAFVGELVSRVYLPFWLESGRLYDGLQGNESGLCPELSAKAATRVLPDFQTAICPYCGGDLRGKSFSLVFACSCSPTRA